MDGFYHIGKDPMFYLVSFVVLCKMVSAQKPTEITPPERCITYPMKAPIPKNKLI